MKYAITLTERPASDPQEARAMSRLRLRSIEWLSEKAKLEAVEYVFRREDNRQTIMFVDMPSHVELHTFVDADPLVSYCELDIEPLLTPIEMVETLSEYLKLPKDHFTEHQMRELEFPTRDVVPDGSYYYARKTLKPFNPLLPLAEQDKIHLNTISSQRAHSDDREIADYNPVGKPVGILIMEASNWDDVHRHVMDCEVYIDSTVAGFRLLTLAQALGDARQEAARYAVGAFADDL